MASLFKRFRMRVYDATDKSPGSIMDRARLLDLSFQHALAGSAIEDVATQRIIEANPALCRIFGYSREALTGMTFPDLSHPDDRDAAKASIEELLQGLRTEVELEKRYLHQDGHVIDAYVAITLARDKANAPRYLIVQVLDISSRKHAERRLQASNQELTQLAYTDSLTGLWNRRHFDQMLAHEWVRARRYGTPLSVVVLDIDRFKRLNDRFGHVVGDEVLATLGSLLQAQTRAVDVIARYGGEEFAMVLPDTDGVAAHVIAERCRQSVARHRWPRAPVTVSAGVASLERDTATACDLVRAADAALYAAKAQGRNTTIRGRAARK